MKRSLGHRRSYCRASALLLVLAGCGRTTSAVFDARARADVSAQGDVATDDHDAALQDEVFPTGLDVGPPTADAAIDRAGDAAAREAGIEIDALALDSATDVRPTEIPSRQSVRFVVISQRVGWAVAAADRCGAINIERQNRDGTWRTVALGIPYQCGCECPRPFDNASLQSLSSMPVVNWDARELAVITEYLKCPAVPPQTWDMPILRAFWQPVAAGHYRASLAVLDSLPRSCVEQVDTGEALCSEFSGDLFNLNQYKPCRSDRTASAEFDLPESGNIEVHLFTN